MGIGAGTLEELDGALQADPAGMHRRKKNMPGNARTASVRCRCETLLNTVTFLLNRQLSNGKLTRSWWSH